MNGRYSVLDAKMYRVNDSDRDAICAKRLQAQSREFLSNHNIMQQFLFHSGHFDISQREKHKFD